MLPLLLSVLQIGITDGTESIIRFSFFKNSSKKLLIYKHRCISVHELELFYITYCSFLVLPTTFFQYLHLSLFICFNIDYFNLDHMYPHLFFSRSEPNLSRAVFAPCPVCSLLNPFHLAVGFPHHPVKTSPNNLQTTEPQNGFRLLISQQRLVQWTAHCHHSPGGFPQTLADPLAL